MPKYTIDFDEAFDKTLSKLRDMTDATTKADVIRRSVSSYKVLKEMKGGEKILIADKNGKILREIVLP